MKNAVCFDDVTLVPNRSTVLSRKDIDTRIQLGSKFEKFSARPIMLNIPLIAAPMDTITGVEMCVALSELGGLGILHRYCNFEQQMAMIKAIYSLNAKCGIALAATGDFEQRAEMAAELGCEVLCVDIAHGDHVLMEKAIGRLSTNPKLTDCYIIAGNVASASAAVSLAKAGAHCIRTSVGSGAFCTTRVQTGFGLPTLQAVLDIAEVIYLKELKVDLMADGGIRNSGDAVKCLVAGAQLIMVGSLLAATDETPGFVVDGKKEARGMASRNAVFNLDPNKRVHEEGVSVWLSTKGPVRVIVEDFISGVRSGCSYAGVHKLNKMHEAAEFRIVSSAGSFEGSPHILKSS
jgi:IMP dehydrogenase